MMEKGCLGTLQNIYWDTITFWCLTVRQSMAELSSPSIGVSSVSFISDRLGMVFLADSVATFFIEYRIL